MTKNYALGAFAIAMLSLLALVWMHTGSIAPPSGSDAIWFNGGLFLLLLGRFVTEYRFTKPNDVFLNCVATFVGISTLSNPPHSAWWEALRWGSLFIGAVALGLSWDFGIEARREERPLRAFLYQLVVSLGRADVIFSAVFILALLSYFSVDSPQTKVFVIAWGLILLLANIGVPRLAQIASTGRRYPGRTLLGTTHSFLAPSIVFCKRTGDRSPLLHEIVGFAQSGGGACHCHGIVIGERSSANETRIVVALLDCAISGSMLNEKSLLVSIGEEERAELSSTISDEAIQSLSKVVGTVAQGTNISQLRFELFGSPSISAGSMLRIVSGQESIFYQVFDGKIEEERTVSESSRAFVEGEAEQIGSWSADRGGFETHDWVAPERAQIHLVDADDPAPAYQLAVSEMQLGSVPQSNYPVNIDINDFVLYHSAILGVTGAGKSFLTYSIVETCRAKGIKTVCIDPTGDYQRYLEGAVMLQENGALLAFLESTDQHIGIIETASAAMNPIEQARKVAESCLDWCKRTRPDAHILNPQPRLLIVMEEAHLLAPEWNFNPQQNLQSQVNRTAQVVLQARKYGLGFLIVSQRTANVTKSILNQCNTIVSFQAFDETGFDFLKNYMGPFHVRALPNLKPRHGILVGKASRSRRPLMVRFATQMRELQNQPAPPMPIPEPPVEGGPHVEQL